MDAILGIVSGCIGGAILVWLSKNWISERLKQSIEHEYSQKLEIHKAKLKADMQAVLHERQLYQLRTSLFFDHQRETFNSILGKISEIRELWMQKGYDPDAYCLTDTIPVEAAKEFKRYIQGKQLFLDSDCSLVLEMISDTIWESYPEEAEDGKRYEKDSTEEFERVEYLRDKLVEIFQEKIGIITSKAAYEEVALLCGMRLLNKHHFPDINLPIKGALKIEYGDDAPKCVIKAKSNKQELIHKLTEFRSYINKDGHFHEASSKAAKCLEILTRK